MSLSTLPRRLANSIPSFARFLLVKLRASNLHGDARFMSGLELKQGFDPQNNQGFYIGPTARLSASESARNLAVIAPTGAGKTLRLVVPNILKAKGSVVVTDPSGEIYTMTSKAMQQRGYKVKILQPSNPAHSAQYNPLLRRTSIQDARKLAMTLCERVSNDKDPFWAIKALTPLYVTLAALSAMPDKRFANLGNARWLINNFGTDGKQINDLMAAHLDEQLFSEYQAFLAQDFKSVSQHLGTVQAALEPWSDASICQFTAGDTIELENIRDEKTIIYVIVPEYELNQYGTIVNLFYADLFRHCYQHKDGLPVSFLLDEMGNLGPIENFSTTITTLRKYHCSITCILQDIEQLSALYGREKASAMFNGGIATKIYLPGLGDEACQRLEKALGTRSQVDNQFGGIDDQARSVAKPLLHMDEIRMLKDDQAIVISGNKLPALIKTQGIWQDKALWRASKQEPVKLKFSGHTKMSYLALRSEKESQLMQGQMPHFMGKIEVPETKQAVS